VTGSSRQKLLFIAPHLPRFDKYSGDLRMFRFLEILARDFDVVFIAQDKTGEGPEEEGRYRAALAGKNVRVHVGEFSLPSILLEHDFRAAIIEFYYIADHYIPRIRMLRPNCRVVVDTVDIHYRRAFSRYGLTGEARDLEAAERTKKEEVAVYRRADLVLAVTDEDARILGADCPGLAIRVIPNIHDPAAVREANGNRNLLFVGGFGHEPNVDAVLYFCKEIFPAVRRAVPECSLTIVGSNPPDEIRRLQGGSIRVAGFVPSLDPVFRDSYVSVAPLRFGAGMKGKVGEAMSEGLPVVTTSVGAQGMGLEHRHNAMVCDSASEFADSVIELLRDRTLYEHVRDHAAEHIRKICGTESVATRVQGMMRELDGLRPKRIGLRERIALASGFLRKALS